MNRPSLVLASLLLPAMLAVSAGAAVNFIPESVILGSGQGTSIKIDKHRNPCIAFASSGDLKYATRVGDTWLIETVDNSANNTGQSASLALDSNDEPRISYFDATVTDVKYAFKSNGVWSTEVVVATANSVGSYSSLALDPTGAPHIAYYDATLQKLYHAWKQGGTWSTEMVQSTSNNVGQYASIGVDASGAVHIAYYDATATDLRYAKKVGGTWTTELVDNGGSFSAGYFCSLALDALGVPHLSYAAAVSASTAVLKYANRSTGTWATEQADGVTNQALGGYSAITIDENGNPHIAHQNQSEGYLRYTVKQWGAWSTQQFNNGNDQGTWASIAVDSMGWPHIAAWGGGLRYAHVARVQTPTPGTEWPVGSLRDIKWTSDGTGTFDVYMSLDGGYTFDKLRESVTASPVGTMTSVRLRVPHTPTRYAQIRVQRQSPYVAVFSDSLFTINAAISLLKLHAEPTDETGRGVTLSWQTKPGPEDLQGYRVERRGDGGGWVTAGATRECRLEDAQGRAGDSYRLIAVNGLGAETVVGESSVAGDLSLKVSPVPYRSGDLRISYSSSGIGAASGTNVEIYDAGGRLVRELASRSNVSGGTGTVLWDGRNAGGNTVAAGLYFVRLRRGDGLSEQAKLVVVR